MAEEDIQIEETVGTAPEAVTTVIDEEDNLMVSPYPKKESKKIFTQTLQRK